VSEPRWQLTSIFPGLASAEYRAARREIGDRLDALEASIEEHAIGAGPALPASAANVERAERLIAELNDLIAVVRTVSAYLSGFTSVDAFDDAAQAESSTLRAQAARGTGLEARVTAWLGRFEPEALAAASDVLAGHVHHLRLSAHRARHQMGDEAESLAAALDESGGGAWERLHDDLIARAATSLRLPGEDAPRSLGVAALVNLQADPDRAVRRAAFEAEAELLSRHELAHAAAMNGIKGQVRTLTSRRRWGDALEMATFEQGIDPEAWPPCRPRSRGPSRRCVATSTPRRGSSASSASPGTTSRDRPPGGRHALHLGGGERIRRERFESFSDRLAAFARRALGEGWVDVPPRAGKVSGAFCASVPLRSESRIMLNWGGTLDDVFTLAHELGHAYHNDCTCRFGRTFAADAQADDARRDGLDVLRDARRRGDAGGERRADAPRGAGAGPLLGRRHHRRHPQSLPLRARRVPPPRRARALGRRARRADAGGAGGDVRRRHRPDARFPKAWAEKPHYYSSDLSFYNFPYTFGNLFAVGLYARYREDPERFVTRYDEFLASTGMDDRRIAGEGDGDRHRGRRLLARASTWSPPAWKSTRRSRRSR
jgi:oligoendopeptidase F